MTVFSEHQRFALWVYILGIVVLCISLGAMLPGVHARGGKQATLAIVLFAVGLLLLLFDVLTLRTRVDSDGVHVCLGRPVPMLWKRIGIDEIRGARVVAYRPLLDANGWGMRFGRFDGRFAIYWNARGNRGVLIETDKRRYIIGSQDPESLYAAIERVRPRLT